MRNWKTSLAGIVAIVSVLIKMYNGEPIGTEEYATLSVAAGLLGAKDFDVSHTKP